MLLLNASSSESMTLIFLPTAQALRPILEPASGLEQRPVPIGGEGLPESLPDRRFRDPPEQHLGDTLFFGRKVAVHRLRVPIQRLRETAHIRGHRRCDRSPPTSLFPLARISAAANAAATAGCPALHRTGSADPGRAP